jgi:tape measure domain-containing protein
MATEAFSLIGRIALDGQKKVRDGLRGISDRADRTGEAVGGLRGRAQKLGAGIATVGRVAAGAAAGGIAILGGAVGTTGIQFNAMQEQSKVAWETLLGTADAADKMIGKIQDFAATTPFAVENVDMMAKYMHNAGYEGQQMFDQLMKISDTASAFSLSASEAQEMARQMSQVQQAGVAYTEDLNILQDRGIPIFKAIAEEQGVMVKDVKKLASEGKITSEVYNAAFDRIAGGVEGASKKQSKTFNGMISTLKDNFGMLAGAMSEPFFNFLKGVLPQMISGVETLTALFKEGGWQAVFKKILPPDVYNFLLTAFTFMKNIFNRIFGSEGQGLITAYISYITGFWSMLKKVGATFTWLWEIIQFVWGLAKPFLQQTFAMILQFWNQYGEQFKRAIVNAFKMIQAIIMFAMPVIKAIIGGTWAAIKNIIKGAIKVILGIIKVFTGIFTGDFSALWSGLKDIFFGGLQLIWGLLNTFLLGRLLGGIKAFGRMAIKPFKTFFKTVRINFKQLKRFIGRIIDGIVGFFRNLAGKLKIDIPRPKLPVFSLRGKLDLVPPGLSVPKLGINWRAQGGFLNKPQLIGAGEVKEAILPLENRKNMQPFAQAVAENLQGSAGKRVEIPIHLNGREIIRAILPDLDQEMARRKNRQSGLVNRGNL